MTISFFSGRFSHCTHFKIVVELPPGPFSPPGFPGGLIVTDSACQSRRHGFDPWVRKTPRSRKWQPTPIFLPGKSHGQRSLAGYSPWGQKESATTEWLSTHTHSFHILFQEGANRLNISTEQRGLSEHVYLCGQMLRCHSGYKHVSDNREVLQSSTVNSG